MTGMKEGAGEDPFADDDPTSTRSDDAESAATGETADESAESSRPATGATGRASETDEPADGTSETADVTSGGRAGGSRRSRQVQIPYKFRRDGVQDGRDRVPLFLQGETKRAEREALRELEERFDADVSLTDLREALVMAGLDHLDEVEAHLEEWGYGMTFDE